MKNLPEDIYNFLEVKAYEDRENELNEKIVENEHDPIEVREFVLQLQQAKSSFDAFDDPEFIKLYKGNEKRIAEDREFWKQRMAELNKKLREYEGNKKYNEFKIEAERADMEELREHFYQDLIKKMNELPPEKRNLA